MKIDLTIEAEKCPYWNYEKHEPSYTCNGCNCSREGSTIRDPYYGLMVDVDRYCTTGFKVYGKHVEKLEE